MKAGGIMKKIAALVAVALLGTGLVAAQGAKDQSALIAAAKAEGQLTVIALPHDWVNYGEMIQKFSDKYGIQVNELNPDGSSAEEIEAIKANKDNKGPQAPDVIDVGLKFGPEAVAAGTPRALQGLRPGRASRTTSRTRTATGTATTMAPWPSRSTPTSSRTCPRIGPTCSSPSTRASSPSPAIPASPRRPT
jgi:hypothetical protein